MVGRAKLLWEDEAFYGRYSGVTTSQNAQLNRTARAAPDWCDKLNERS